MPSFLILYIGRVQKALKSGLVSDQSLDPREKTRHSLKDELLLHLMKQL